MALIRTKELRRLSAKELLEKLKELELELLKLKAQRPGTGAGSKKFKEIKRTIARIKQLAQTKYGDMP